MDSKIKEELHAHVNLQQPIPQLNESSEIFFLNKGQTVEFTVCKRYFSNIKFKINGDSGQYIWYSQLESYLLLIDDDGEWQYGCSDIEVNGELQNISSLGSERFMDIVEGKKYKVKETVPCFKINKYSQTAKELNFKKYGESINYIKRCVDNREISKIGDLLKKAIYYSFVEI